MALRLLPAPLDQRSNSKTWTTTSWTSSVSPRTAAGAAEDPIHRPLRGFIFRLEGFRGAKVLQCSQPIQPSELCARNFLRPWSSRRGAPHARLKSALSSGARAPPKTRKKGPLGTDGPVSSPTLRSGGDLAEDPEVPQERELSGS